MKKLSVLNLGLLVSLFACAASEQWPPAPASVHLGEDACAECRMIISEEQYGAQLHERGKQVQLFDDFGCLLAHRPLADTNTSVIYVRSAQDGSWLRADQASFAVSQQISSPMGYGLAAFPTRESAGEFTRRMNDSKVYSSSELMAQTETILQGARINKE